MAGLFERQAEMYARARPTYPDEWFSDLSSLTAHHNVAWDAGSGNGQAAVKVIATDISESQIKHAFFHPKVQYFHTPESTTEDELIAMLGGEGSIDLVIVATAIHWFDLQSFYSVVNRVLRKPGGIIAVWGCSYNSINIIDSNGKDIMKPFIASTMPFLDSRVLYAFKGYKTLLFPFDSVGLGSEGNPVNPELQLNYSLDEFMTWLRTLSPVATAKAKGVELMNEEFVKELRAAWDGGKSNERKRIVLKAYLIAGKVRLDEEVKR